MLDDATIGELVDLLAPPELPGLVDEWLTEVENEIAGALVEWLRVNLEPVLTEYMTELDRELAAAPGPPGLIAAGADDSVFDAVQTGYTKLIQTDIGEILGGVHMSGALSAWLMQANENGPSPEVLASWLNVTNTDAVTYIANATNRLAHASDEMWVEVRNRARRAVYRGFENEPLTQRIQAVMQTTEFRANTIARTETVGAYNNGNYLGAEALGKYGPAEKWWLATNDARTRPSHAAADGQVVAFTDTFDVGGVSMRYPHDPMAPAGEVVNCRCVMNLLYEGDVRPDGSTVGPPLDLAAEPFGPLVPDLADEPFGPQMPDLADSPFGPQVPAKSIKPIGGKLTDDQLSTWITENMAGDTGKTVAQMWREFRAAGGVTDEKRFYKLAKAAKGGTAAPARAVAAVAPKAPKIPWRKPLQPGSPTALKATTRTKRWRDHLKGREFGSTAGKAAGPAKAEIARNLARRLESRGHVLRSKSWQDAIELGYDPEIAVFERRGQFLALNDRLSDLGKSLTTDADRDLWRRGLLDYRVRDRDWPSSWNDAYARAPRKLGSSEFLLGADPEIRKIMTEARVNELVHQWAITSNDANATSLNMQRAAQIEFDLDPQALAPWNIPEALQARMDADWLIHGDEYRVFLRAMYDETQEMFRELGVTEITVVRGFNFRWGTTPDWAYANDADVFVELRPMSSFAFTQAQANKFAGGVYTYANVPVERIIGSARSGFGCLNETELVVLGGPNSMRVASNLRR